MADRRVKRLIDGKGDVKAKVRRVHGALKVKVYNETLFADIGVHLLDEEDELLK